MCNGTNQIDYNSSYIIPRLHLRITLLGGYSHIHVSYSEAHIVTVVYLYFQWEVLAKNFNFKLQIQLSKEIECVYVSVCACMYVCVCAWVCCVWVWEGGGGQGRRYYIAPIRIIQDKITKLLELLLGSKVLNWTIRPKQLYAVCANKLSLWVVITNRVLTDTFRSGTACSSLSTPIMAMDHGLGGRNTWGAGGGREGTAWCMYNYAYFQSQP